MNSWLFAITVHPALYLSVGTLGAGSFRVGPAFITVLAGFSFGTNIRSPCTGLILRSGCVSTCWSTVSSFWDVSGLLIFVLSAGCAKHAPRMLTRDTANMNRTIKRSILLAIGFSLRWIESFSCINSISKRAVGKFVEDYNAEWRVEKNGFVSPRQARQAWFAALSQQAA